jgi:Holliday junction DNA helicase RuvB
MASSKKSRAGSGAQDPPSPNGANERAQAGDSQRAIGPSALGDDERFDRLFRPQTLAEFVGQSKHTKNLRVYVEAARRREEPLDHILLCGPPGLGKTTLAHVLANEMGVTLHVTSGPAVEHKGVLSGMLTRMGHGDILFIDEIHRLSAAVEECLYPAIEDFRIDVMMGEGAFAESVALDVKPFTLIGATTRTGLLTKPLHERFGVTLRLDFYPVDDLKRIVLRSGCWASNVMRPAHWRWQPALAEHLASPIGFSAARVTLLMYWATGGSTERLSKRPANASRSTLLVWMRWIDAC